MSKTYTMSIKGNPEKKLAHLKEQARRYRIELTGDTHHGQFSGRVEGRYDRSGEVLTVTLSKVPFYMTFDAVASLIQNYLKEG